MGNIPSSTSNKLVFRYNNWTKTFDASSYNAMLTGNRMSFQEVSQTLTNIEDIQKPYTTKMRIAALTYIILFVVIIAVYLYAMSATEDLDNLFMIVMIYVIAILILVFVFICRFRKLKEESQSQAQKAIDHFNQITMPKGLRWSIPIDFPKWIELNIEFQQGVQVIQQGGVYIPLVHQSYPNYENDATVQGQPQPQQYAQNYYGGNQPVYDAQQGGYNLQPVVYNPQQAGYNPHQGGYVPQQDEV